MKSARLLFISPGDNLCHLGRALERVPAEQGVHVEVRNLLGYQLHEGLARPEHVDQLAAWADVILFDIRDNRELVGQLRAWRERDRGKTFVPLMGGSLDVLGLCRMGSFNFDRALRSGRGASVDFRRIEQIATLVEKLGGVLPVGALGHARNWVRVVRYWTAGGADNVESLLRLVLRGYCGGRGPRPRPPIERPTHRIESPTHHFTFATTKAFLAARKPDPALPTVALLYYGGLHHDASAAGGAAIEKELAGRANVLPIATDGVRSLEAVRRFLLCPGAPRVDGIVSLMWFRLNGGPLGGSPAETEEVLRRLDVPYLVPITMYGREREAWAASAQGLSPVEVYATVVLPELDGATAPTPVLALDRATVAGLQVTGGAAIPDRVARLCNRLLALVALRRTPRASRRIALVAYDYPPGPGSAGNASYLDVSRSLGLVLKGLDQAGYDVGDGSEDPLGDLLSAQTHNGNGTGEWRGARLGHDEYRRFWEGLPPEPRREVEGAFGPPPGKLMVDETGLRVPGRWFGNVFVCLQPARTACCDDPRTTHDRALPPHHQYLAFYAFLQARGVHATVHVGTHGTVEFLPGKETGLSASCFPDLLQGDVPQVYVYTIANPSESTLARRRWQAVLVSHHTPDLVAAGLYGDYQELLDRLERTRDPSTSPAQRAAIVEEFRARARRLGLPDRDDDALEDELRQLQHAAIPDGLHTFGRPKDGLSLSRYLGQLARRSVAGVRIEETAREAGDASLAQTWPEDFVRCGALPQALRRLLEPRVAGELERSLRELSAAYLADEEMGSLTRALDGRFVPPGLMGDPLRSPGVYPTGRNGYSFDPTRIPHPDAIVRGAILGRALVERYVAASGAPPRMVGLVLWGFETARTGGETIGQLLYLVGARVADAPGWLPSYEPIPSAQLGRPRVDVHLMMCGFFRDMFPALVRDLDLLLRRIASLDEPPELNPLRAHSLSLEPTVGADLSGARIFGPAPGEYGTGMPDYVGGSSWRAESDLGEIFTRAMGHVYGAGAHGTASHATFRALLGMTEAVAQVVDGDDYKLGDLDHYYEFLGGAARAVHGVRGVAPRCLVGDSARDSPRVEDAGDELRRCCTTRLLNPRWIEGMLAHPRHGARKIEDRVTNLIGFAGTVGVPSRLFDQVFERYVADEELFERLRANNPHAAAGVARRLAEAHRRQFWQATEEQLRTLRDRFKAVEPETEAD